MTQLKLALVVDWPSIDAPKGQLFSAWETQVIQELQNAADFQPIHLGAYNRHVNHLHTLFEGGKIGGQPLAHVAKERQNLHDALVGYDVALSMGPFALWALTGETKLDLYRGTHVDSPFVEGLQVVPTYSPSIFCRLAWNERPVVVSAMKKATSKFIDKPRAIFLPESVADLYAFSTKYIKDKIVFDVETCRGGRITEFSLAPTSSRCLYVQLENRFKESIWLPEDELDILLWLRWLAAMPDLSWGFHNATYDLTYLDTIDVRPVGPIFDTMLEHHAYQPEWEKSLGFLAGLHVPTRAWKHLRTKAKNEFNKAGALE